MEKLALQLVWSYKQYEVAMQLEVQNLFSILKIQSNAYFLKLVLEIQQLNVLCHVIFMFCNPLVSFGQKYSVFLGMG